MGNVEDDAVEVEESLPLERDIAAVIAMEGRGSTSLRRPRDRPPAPPKALPARQCRGNGAAANRAGAALSALFTPAADRTPEQAARVALDDALIAQVQAADVLVLGAPMYNFGMTVQLKGWFDAIARANVTFDTVDPSKSQQVIKGWVQLMR